MISTLVNYINAIDISISKMWTLDNLNCIRFVSIRERGWSNANLLFWFFVLFENI